MKQLKYGNYGIKGRQKFISGGNDSLFCIWEDKTKEEEAKKIKEEHEILIDQQNFYNMMREENYYEAAILAFKKNMVKNFQNSLESIFAKFSFSSEIIYNEFQIKQNVENKEIENDQTLKEFVLKLIEEDFNKLLIFIRDINITSKKCKIAQKLLMIIFKLLKLEQFQAYNKTFALNEKKKKEKIGDFDENSDFEKILTIIQSYSERHKERLERFIKKSFYLEFFLKKLNYLEEE